MIATNWKSAFIDIGRTESLHAWVDAGARWLLASVFLAASLPKIVAPHQFSEVIGAYGLLPEMMLLPAAVGIAWGELVTAIGLLVRKEWAVVSTLFFMVIFIAVLSYGVYLGLDIDCGCFGPEDPEHVAFSGLRTALARDVLLLIPLSFSCWFWFVNKRKKEKK